MPKRKSAMQRLGLTAMLRSGDSRLSRSRCIAGKATTSVASRACRAKSAEDWRSRATIPDGHARQANCAWTFEKAVSLIPGRHRINLHAIYAESGGTPVDRDQVRPEHFAGWIDWARETGLGS